MPLANTSGQEDRFQNMELRQAVQSMPAKSTTFTSSNATTGAVTLNAGAGILTSEALSLVGATEYVLTVSNNMVTTTDFVIAQLGNGTNTVSPGPQVANVTVSASFFTVRIVNENVTAAVNGTVKIGFLVVKQVTSPSPP